MLWGGVWRGKPGGLRPAISFSIPGSLLKRHPEVMGRLGKQQGGAGYRGTAMGGRQEKNLQLRHPFNHSTPNLLSTRCARHYGNSSEQSKVSTLPEFHTSGARIKLDDYVLGGDNC